MANEFGGLLRKYRIDARLSQRAVVEKLRMANYEAQYREADISKWEHGRIPREDIVEELEDMLSTPKGILLRAAGYRSAAEYRRLVQSEQMASLSRELEMQPVDAVSGITTDCRAVELVKHIVSNNASAGMRTINSIRSDGLDLHQFGRQVVQYLRGLLLIMTRSDQPLPFTIEDMAELKSLATRASLPRILKAIRVFGQPELCNYSILSLEVALADCIRISEEEVQSPIPQAGTAFRAAEATHQTAKSSPTRTPTPAVPEPTSTIPLPQLSKGIERLRLNWRQIIKQSSDDTKASPVIAVLRTVEPAAIGNNCVVLACKHPLHEKIMGVPGNRRVVEKIIEGFLGYSLQCSCIYKPDDYDLVKEALKMGARIVFT